MTALIAAVLTASLIGSSHCAGMCGAFVLFAVGAPETSSAGSRARLNAAYNLGRLMTYVTLGTIAGGLGAALNLGGSMLGVQRLAASLAGAMMIGFGIIAVLRSVNVRVPRLPLPPGLTRLAKAGHARAFELTPITRAAAVGALTTLLPCGWLYAFVVTSAGTASPILGAITMAAFWLGTLPMMATIGLGVQTLSGPLRHHLPLATSLLLVGVGVWTLFGRVTAPAFGAESLHAPVTIREAMTSAGAADKACPLCTSK